MEEIEFLLAEVVGICFITPSSLYLLYINLFVYIYGSYKADLESVLRETYRFNLLYQYDFPLFHVLAKHARASQSFLPSQLCVLIILILKEMRKYKVSSAMDC